MAAQLDDSLADTHCISLLEIVKFLEEAAARDEVDLAATGDEQKRMDASERRRRAIEIRTLLALGTSSTV